MRVLVIVVAALATLGLAAFGVVAAQKAGRPGGLLSVAQHTQQCAGVCSQQSDRSGLNAGTDRRTVDAGPARARRPLPSRIRAPSNKPTNGIPACDKPGGMGLSRIVQIDTTGGPAFGFEHFKQYDFLRDHEVVLTFDDGPWPGNTPAVIKALTDQCLKATFFEIGEHATWHPEISKMVAAAGMTIGSHTWSHKDLARNPYASDIEQAKQEIEMGVSAVHHAVDGPIAPFFRFPDLQQPPELLTYLGFAQHRDLLDRYQFLRLQVAPPRAGRQVGHDQAEKARQGHCADARLPARDRGGHAGIAAPAQGERL